jgi:phosphoribosylformylglycinamidine cyclo-ligase
MKADPVTDTTSSDSSKYTQAGVNIDTGNAIVRAIKDKVRGTFSPRVLADIGLFGGLFDVSGLGCSAPVLVSSIDGVGTKLHIAAAVGRYDGVGHDIVAHCCNDVVVQGARPLFFLDYIAAARLDAEAVAAIVGGMADECLVNGVALVGGETAEMPGTYAEGQTDVVGCIIGVVDRQKIIDGKTIVPGDVLVGLPSSGLHTNGYSLARKVLLEDARLELAAVPEGCDRPLADILLEPHRSYVPLVLDLIDKVPVKGLAHITGGGLIENVPRILPAGCGVKIDTDAIDAPPIFDLIQRLGEVTRAEMYRVFNMGIGMVVIVGQSDAGCEMQDARCRMQDAGCGMRIIGEVCAGDGTVQLG